MATVVLTQNSYSDDYSCTEDRTFYHERGKSLDKVSIYLPDRFN